MESGLKGATKMAGDGMWSNRKQLPYSKPALEEILDQLENCCRRHEEQAGNLPICEICWQRYKNLAERGEKYKITSEDIRHILEVIE
jgi:hypothetical protein